MMQIKNLLSSTLKISLKYHYVILIILLLISLIIKNIYIFYYTEYETYLVSDMGGYWERAIRSYTKGDSYPIQWYLYPSFPHITLAWFFKLLNYFGLFHQKLNIVLFMNTILSIFSTLFVYLIALKLDKSKNYALLIVFIYAFFFPLIYLNTFILTEHLGLFVFLLSIVLLFYLELSLATNLIVIGLLLSFSVAIRPPFGISGLIFVIYIWFNIDRNFLKKVQGITFFSISFFLFLFMISINTFHISDGKVRTLSANGGSNLYLSMCDANKIQVHDSSNNIDFYVKPPINAHNPEKVTLNTNIPFYNQKFYKDKALECLANNKYFWRNNLIKLQYLYFESMFPSFHTARYSEVLIPIFSYIALFLTVVLLFSPLIFYIKETEKAKIFFLFGLILAQLIVYYFFNVEQRFLYGFFFAILLLSLLTILIIMRHFTALKKFYFILLFIYTTLYLYYSIDKLTVDKNITMHIFQNNTDVKSLYQVRDGIIDIKTKINTIDFKTVYKLEHRNLGSYPYDKNIFIDFFTKMIVNEDIKVKFIVASDDGFSLWIDNKKIIDFPNVRSIRKNEISIDLKKDIYKIKLSYFQGHGHMGLRVYYLIEGKRYLLGENSQKVKFK